MILDADSFFVCRVCFDCKRSRSRLRFLTMSGGWTTNISSAQEFKSRQSATSTLRKRPGSIFDGPTIRQSGYLFNE